MTEDLDAHDLVIVGGLARLQELGLTPIALVCHPENVGRAAPYAAAHNLPLETNWEHPIVGEGSLTIRFEGEAPNLDGQDDDDDEPREPWRGPLGDPDE